MPDAACIEVSDLTKTYRTKTTGGLGVRGAIRGLVRPDRSEITAVDGLTFAVRAGERVGFIGVNGAGKSTTIKMLTGILTSTSGTVRVLGRDPHKERVANARDIGAVFGQRTQLWWDLPLRDSLQLVGQMYQVPDDRLKALTAEFTETLDLDELLTKPIRTMSLGQKMRAELAATLIHEPRIVFLDEPTIGLDVIAKKAIREFILRANQTTGTTVFLTTHDMGDLEELTDRIIVIDQGRMLFDGSLGELKRRYGVGRTLTVIPRDALTEADVAALRLPTGASVAASTETELTIRIDPDLTGPPQVVTAVFEQLAVEDFTLSETDLGHVVTRIHTEGRR